MTDLNPSPSRQLGVCSWSLRPDDPADLAQKVQEVEVRHVQLALDPLVLGDWNVEETRAVLEDAGISILSGMMQTKGEDYSTLDSIRETGGLRPDAHWEWNLAHARATAALARRLDLDLVTFHAGFLPEDAADPERAKLLDRLRQVVDAFSAEGVVVAFETGQETAENLDAALAELDRPDAGVNFDPANMILYDMGNPVEALTRLADRVHQIHVKDAVRTLEPGTWGEEVPAGAGQVNWAEFFEVVRERGLDVDLVIEREAGEDRLGDARQAAELVRQNLGAGVEG